MFRFLLILCGFLSASFDSGARELYECVRPGAARSFQDVPCAGSDARQNVRVLREPSEQEAARIKRASAVHEHADAQFVARFERTTLASLPESLGGPPAPRGARVSHAPRRDRRETLSACEQARSRREQAYRRDGNRMGFDERRKLQDAMTDACGL